MENGPRPLGCDAALRHALLALVSRPEGEVEMTSEHVTNAVATGAVVSPYWLPSLMDVSQFAGVMLPILGAIWLLVQIISRITGWHR